MALNLWVMGGKPASYNPLPIGWGNTAPIGIGNYTVTVKAKSASNARLYFGLYPTIVNLPSYTLSNDFQTFTFTFSNTLSGQVLRMSDYPDIKGDIIIDSISLVQAPLPKLTINGVDGFTSGKWNFSNFVTVLDDQTVLFTPQSIATPNYLLVNVIPNTQYTYSFGRNDVEIAVYNSDATFSIVGYTLANSITFNSGTYSQVRLYFKNNSQASGSFTLSKPMLNVGSVPAPYSPKTGDRMVMPYAKNNLLPPLSKVSNQLLNNAVITGDHSLSLSVSDAPSYHSSYFSIPVVSGKTYTVSGVTNDPNACIRVHAGIGFSGALVGGIINSNSSSYFSFIADDSFNGYASVRLDNNGANGTFNFNSLQVVEGTIPFGIAQENKLPQKHVPKKNLFDGMYTDGAYINQGSYAFFNNNTVGCECAIIPCQPNTNYTITLADASNRFTVGSYPSITSGTNAINATIVSSGNTYTINSGTGANYLIVYVSNASEKPRLQVEQGSTATSYEPYTLVLPPSNKGLSFNTIGQSDFVNLAINFDEFEIDFIYQFNSLSSYPTLLTLGAQSSLVPFYWLYSDVLGRINLQATNGTNYTTNALPYNFINGQRYLIHIKHVSDGFDVYINGLYFKFSGSYLVPTSSSCYLMCYPGIHFNQGTLNSFKTWKNGSIVAQYDFTNQRNIVGNTLMQNAQNLIPSFEDSGWTINSNAKVMGKDTLHLDATAGNQDSTITIPVLPNESYTLTSNPLVYNAFIGGLISGGGTAYGWIQNGTPMQSFTTGASQTSLNLILRSTTSGSFDFIRPQLYQLDGTEGRINGSPVQLNKPSKRSLYAKR